MQTPDTSKPAQSAPNKRNFNSRSTSTIGQRTGRRRSLSTFIQSAGFWLVINSHWLVTVLLGLALGVLQ